MVKAGYIPIKPDDVYIRKSDGKVRGKGCWHDIDALGRFSYPLLYVIQLDYSLKQNVRRTLRRSQTYEIL